MASACSVTRAGGGSLAAAWVLRRTATNAPATRTAPTTQAVAMMFVEAVDVMPELPEFDEAAAAVKVGERGVVVGCGTGPGVGRAGGLPGSGVGAGAGRGVGAAAGAADGAGAGSAAVIAGVSSEWSGAPSS